MDKHDKNKKWWNLKVKKKIEQKFSPEIKNQLWEKILAHSVTINTWASSFEGWFPEKYPATTNLSQHFIRFTLKSPGSTPYALHPPTPSATPITSAFPRTSATSSELVSPKSVDHSSTCRATKYASSPIWPLSILSILYELPGLGNPLTAETENKQTY